MGKPNEDIRNAIKQAKIHTYEVADQLLIHENTLYRMLRKEIPKQKKELIFSIIKQMDEKSKDNGLNQTSPFSASE